MPGWNVTRSAVMRMISVMAAAVAGLALVGGSVTNASAGPYWNKKTKCEQTDPEGRVIPTRYGNGDLGWNHFSGKHNIKKCRIINAAVAGKVDKKSGGAWSTTVSPATRPGWSTSWSSCNTPAELPTANTTRARARRSA